MNMVVHYIMNRYGKKYIDYIYTYFIVLNLYFILNFYHLKIVLSFLNICTSGSRNLILLSTTYHVHAFTLFFFMML